MVMVTDQYCLVTYLAIKRAIYLNVHEEIPILVITLVGHLMDTLQQFSVIVSIIMYFMKNSIFYVIKSPYLIKYTL